MASPSGRSSGIIEIEVKSAKLNSIKLGKFYVQISLSQTQELRTKLVKSSKTFTPPWNQKFVFSVPHNFVFDDTSLVSFTVFRARKYFPDTVVGRAAGEMRALFPIDESKQDHGRNATYEDDAEIQDLETFELKAVAGVPILKDSCVVGTLNISVAAWEEYFPDEMNLYGRPSKSFSIFRGSEKVGSMTVQKAGKQENCVTFVGNVNWRNLAMEFEEFMMQREAEKRPKRSLAKIVPWIRKKAFKH